MPEVRAHTAALSWLGVTFSVETRVAGLRVAAEGLVTEGLAEEGRVTTLSDSGACGGFSRVAVATV